MEKLCNMNNKVAVIYFDDMQIVGRVAKRECGLALTNLATVRREYNGIMNGDFADRENFTATLSEVIRELARTVGKVPEMLYIGVPNVFCRVETQQTEIEFDRVTKINKNHIKMLWSDTQFNEENREIIAKRALCFKLEEYEDVMLDVVGMSTTNLQMISSAISISNEFRPLIDLATVRGVGFTDFEFINIAECELFMIPEKHRDAGCSLVRSDFFSTSVANVLGDGITQLSRFDMGAGHIVKDIVESFSVDYTVAMGLLKQCTPTFQMLLEQSYTANGQSMPAGIFNDFIAKRVNEFGERLAGLDLARVVYLSGGNLADVYGVKNMLSNACDRRMYLCKDVLTTQTDYPENTLNAMVRFVLAK